jgi:hypothetical protein
LTTKTVYNIIHIINTHDRYNDRPYRYKYQRRVIQRLRHALDLHYATMLRELKHLITLQKYMLHDINVKYRCFKTFDLVNRHMRMLSKHSRHLHGITRIKIRQLLKRLGFYNYRMMKPIWSKIVRRHETE